MAYMTDSFNKNDYNHMISQRKSAFRKIAEKLGKEHKITKMMGSRAWGRHKDEQGAKGTLRSAIFEMGSLDGAFDILNHWARDNDYSAQKIMLEIYPMKWEKAK